jgi:hypothetical protein
LICLSFLSFPFAGANSKRGIEWTKANETGQNKNASESEEYNAQSAGYYVCEE